MVTARDQATNCLSMSDVGARLSPLHDLWLPTKQGRNRFCHCLLAAHQATLLRGDHWDPSVLWHPTDPFSAQLARSSVRRVGIGATRMGVDDWVVIALSSSKEGPENHGSSSLFFSPGDTLTKTVQSRVKMTQRCGKSREKRILTSVHERCVRT